MENKQTAVEWLKIALIHDSAQELQKWISDLFYQALELEKQQIIDANIAGLIYPYVPGKPFGLEIAEQSKAEKYYNETFKNENHDNRSTKPTI